MLRIVELFPFSRLFERAVGVAVGSLVRVDDRDTVGLETLDEAVRLRFRGADAEAFLVSDSDICTSEAGSVDSSSCFVDRRSKGS